jgi:hypothetical protein
MSAAHTPTPCGLGGAYEQLVGRVRAVVLNYNGSRYPSSRDIARNILAEVLRALELEAEGTGNETIAAKEFREDLLDWLRTSSLNQINRKPQQ